MTLATFPPIRTHEPIGGEDSAIATASTVIAELQSVLSLLRSNTHSPEFESLLLSMPETPALTRVLISNTHVK